MKYKNNSTTQKQTLRSYALAAVKTQQSSCALCPYKELNLSARHFSQQLKILNKNAHAREDFFSPLQHFLRQSHLWFETKEELQQAFSAKLIKKLPQWDKALFLAQADGTLKQRANLPRIFALSYLYLEKQGGQWSKESFTRFINQQQAKEKLYIKEIWQLSLALQFWLLLKIQQRAADLLQAPMDTPPAPDSTAEVYFNVEALEKIDVFFNTLKSIQDFNWAKWREKHCIVDALLREHAEFSSLDTSSRAAYRSAIEDLAEKSQKEEAEITKAALYLAQKTSAHSQAQAELENCVGYYLIGEGRDEMEKFCHYQPSAWCQWQKYLKKHGLPVIMGCLLGTSFLTGFAVFGLFFFKYCCPAAIAVFFGVLSLFLGFTIGEYLVARVAGFLVSTQFLVGYNFQKALPPCCQTLVAIPSLLLNCDQIEQQVKILESHYLSNKQKGLYFCLLTDWIDSNESQNREDEALLQHATALIAQLNKKYSPSTARFFLLHRKRCWNAQENCFMGWERKRGKLQELNQLLRGDKHTNFFPVDPALPRDITYVMTLDSDTQLTPHAVVKLVGKLAHPLNKPIFDKKAGKLSHGFSLLQPRLAASLALTGESSVFQKIYSIEQGLDPYLSCISDLYQDFTGKGSFVGKGLYHVDSFMVCLKNKIKDNLVLSHDLLEGGYANCAFTSDVELIEDYPTSYLVDSARHHRWIRGDWQLLPFLKRQSGLNGVTRWKIFCNLLRSLSPIIIFSSLLLSWYLLPARLASFYCLFALASFVFSSLPALLPRFLISFLLHPKKFSFLSLFYHFLHHFEKQAAFIFLKILLLPHTALMHAHAISLALFRFFISHKKRLEWQSFAASTIKMRNSKNYLQAFAPALLVCFFSFMGCALLHLPTVFLAGGFLLFWLQAPLIAYKISQESVQQGVKADKEDLENLSLIACKNWLFFEEFVTEETHYLPADNFQEQPKEKLSYKTSPTNIGLYLLSVLSAYEFGWLTGEEFFTRLENCLATIKKLEKYKGHLYNWYNIKTLTPLAPFYISSVDSGNFVGHLFTLQSALGRLSKNIAAFLEPPHKKSLLTLCAALEPNTIRSETFRCNLQLMKRCIKENAPWPDLYRQSLQLSTLIKIYFPHDRQAKAFSKKLQTLCAYGQKTSAVLDHKRKLQQEKAYQERLTVLAKKINTFALNTNFTFLQNPDKELLSIGYNVTTGKLDVSCYDLLASEARLASFIAIAKGDLPPKHWSLLGRRLTLLRGKSMLFSWSGSMFEYLMPSLIMKEPEGSLLFHTHQRVIQEQQNYAKKNMLPWGISEAAFNKRDAEQNYQYSSFGAPKLALDKEALPSKVVAPYASFLALQFCSLKKVTANLQNLETLGALGTYGYFDAVDFTTEHLLPQQKHAVIRNYYAHHQAMSLLALYNVFFSNQLQEDFHRCPLVQAHAILLHEKNLHSILRPLKQKYLFSCYQEPLPRPSTRINIAIPLHALSGALSYQKWKFYLRRN